jgi:hypothetical protein
MCSLGYCHAFLLSTAGVDVLELFSFSQLIQCSLLLSALYMFRGGFSAHHQELIKLYVQPCVLSLFPAVYRWCGCVGTVQRQPTYTSPQHVSGGFSAHHQELIKLYVQPWVLSCFPVVYRWCGWVGTVQRQPTCTMFFIVISPLHVSGGFSAHHQEHIKLYVQPWVLSCFPAV